MASVPVPSAALGGVSPDDWLHCCRRAVEGLREVLRDHPTSRERVVETGETGEGGDKTLVIDQQAEDLIFEELQAIHDRGARFTAVSEERGTVDFGDPGVLVVIDPIDGSLNAKRGITHHGLSIAVAAGDTMDDVVFGYVFDLGPQEEWWAVRGGGAFLDGERLDPPDERRSRDGKLELVAVESADPRWIQPSITRLAAVAGRLRVIGSIAVSLCQVAAARCDGMVSLWRTRAVDAAAAQLIVRESGGHIAFPGADGPLGAPLDLEPHHPVVAARTARGLAELSEVPSP
jgi:myo-inositol-1(or 4)-monophosphatase